MNTYYYKRAGETLSIRSENADKAALSIAQEEAETLCNRDYERRKKAPNPSGFDITKPNPCVKSIHKDTEGYHATIGERLGGVWGIVFKLETKETLL